ncbi:hypothetical protein FACS189437_05650 [Bacteroidia bacterium]|nr:hypothetical protein FACS189437_05650 [Bacteroidia bacterium]
MKMKKMMLLMLVFFLGITASMNAQVRVGGTADPNPNALLDVNKDTITVTGNNTKGLALPRVALTSTTAAAPVGTTFVRGMLVYNTNTAGDVTPGAYYSNGAKWIRVSGSDAPIAGWQLGGNTTADGDFIGAINNKPLVFKINGDTVGYVNKGTIAAWGDKALTKTTGGQNTAIGGSALAANTTGTYNTAVGTSSLFHNIEGAYNTAIGPAALYNNTASGNTSVGGRSLYANTTGSRNVAVGDSALRLNTTASGNTAVGYRALVANTTGQYNTVLGDSASVKITTGSNNTTIGHLAGFNITTGSKNIVIGDSAVAVSATASNQLKIGNWITGTNGRVRIGNANPHATAVLDLNADNTTTPVENLGGVALPRISLDTVNSQLNSAYPIQGTIIYNTNASIKGAPGAGIYIWTGASSSSGKWANLAPTVLSTSVTISPSGTVRLTPEANITLEATTAPDNATNPIVKWTSDNTAVATVSSKGKVTAVDVGTATITATTVDGSNKSRSVNVIVFEAAITSERIGTRDYNVVTLPDGLGTWMLSFSREGTPTYTNGTNTYYNYAAAPSACPAPYVVPDSAQYKKMRDFERTTAPGMYFMGQSSSVGFLGGYYRTATDLRYYGTRNLNSTSTITANNEVRTFMQTGLDGQFGYMTSIMKTSAAMVRCVKP